MALSAASCLHYWSSRYGHIPVVGGKPVHTRASTARLVDIASQQLVEVPCATPRDTHLVTISGEERGALLLEMAATNNTTRSTDLTNAAWDKSGVTVAASALPDPAGGTGAFTVTATAANGDTSNNAGASTSIVRTTSMWIRRRTGTGTISLWTSAAGMSVVAVTDVWQRFSAVSGATTNRFTGVRIAISGDAIDVYLPQNEDRTFATSEIPTLASAVTRAADSFYWDYTPAPQGMFVYCRFIERGTIDSDDLTLFQIGAGGAGALLLVYRPASSYYRVYHHNGTAAVTSTLAVKPVVGDTVELVAVLGAGGIVEIIQSINGGAVTSSTPSGVLALAPTFTQPKFHLATGDVGAASFAEIKVVKYADVVGATAQARMDELRNFELGPNRELLAAA